MGVGVFTPVCHHQGRWVSKATPHIKCQPWDSLPPPRIHTAREGRLLYDDETGPERGTDLPRSHSGKQSQNKAGLTPEASLCTQFLHQPPACQATYPPSCCPTPVQTPRCQASSCGPAASLPLPPQSSLSPSSGLPARRPPPTLAGPSGPAWRWAGGGRHRRRAVGQMPGLQPLLRRSPTLPRTTSCRICGVRYQTKTCRSLLKTHTAQ